VISCGLLGSLLNSKRQDINTAALAGCNFHPSTPHHPSPDYDDIQWVLTTNDFSNTPDTLRTRLSAALDQVNASQSGSAARALDHRNVLRDRLPDLVLERNRQGDQAGAIHPTINTRRRILLAGTPSQVHDLGLIRWPG
jgi:hypothetical protein